MATHSQIPDVKSCRHRRGGGDVEEADAVVVIDVGRAHGRTRWVVSAEGA